MTTTNKTKGGDMIRRMPLNLKYIRARRMELGLTQQEAADAAGFPNLQKWSQYETGKIPDPQLSTLEAIAKALKCKLSQIVKDQH